MERRGSSAPCQLRTHPADCVQPMRSRRTSALMQPTTMFSRPRDTRLPGWSGQTLVSHTACTGQFEGAHPFRVAGRLID